MKNLKFALAFLFVLIGSQSAFSQMVYRGTVVEIVDGKTVVIELRERNRLTVELQHIEVPEPGQELYQTVRDHLGKLLLGRQVEYQANRLELTKTVGQVMVDGVDASLQMLRDGAAWHAPLQAGERANENYRSAEAQARIEKRGVWSIPNLKPAWIFRAERNKINQPAAGRDETTNIAETGGNESADAATGYGRPRQPQQKRPAAAPNANVEMWADVNDYSKIKESVYSSGLLTAYNQYMNWGYLSTPDADFNTSAGEAINRAVYRVGYFYKGSQLLPGQEAFLFLMEAHSKKWAFAESNNLVIVADRREINVGKARRLARQAGSSAVEVLLYRISRASLAKIAAAKKVEMKIGAHRSALDAKQQKMIKTLLADSE